MMRTAILFLTLVFSLTAQPTPAGCLIAGLRLEGGPAVARSTQVDCEQGWYFELGRQTQQLITSGNVAAVLARFEASARTAPADVPLPLVGAVAAIASHAGRPQLSPADRKAILFAAGFIRNPSGWAERRRPDWPATPWYTRLRTLLDALAAGEGDTRTLAEISDQARSAPAGTPPRLAALLRELGDYDPRDRAAIAYLAATALMLTPSALLWRLIA
jgi:hypothetical protein